MAFSKQKKQHKERLVDLADKLEDHQTPAEVRAAEAKRPPTREQQRRALVEKRIQEAIENGEFDDLPGKGKPLPLDENPYLEPGQEWAFGLLRRNGFAPEWIERDKAIRREIESTRKRLRRMWQLYQEDQLTQPQWQAILLQFEADLDKLNQKIDDFNLVAPTSSVHRSRLRLADELTRQGIKQSGMP